MRLRDKLVDGPTSVGATMRARRWALLRELFPEVESYHVLDLGGTTEYWRRAPITPKHVTVVNLFEPGEGGPGIEPVTGNACDFSPSQRYDLVVSNSLVEHVGGHAMRARLAEVIRGAAERHWVQTPYRYFPLEPHWLFPGMQFLPLTARCTVAMRWPLVHTRPTRTAEAMQAVLWTELVSKTEMKVLFPDSDIRFERMVGLPKSLIMLRR